MSNHASSRETQLVDIIREKLEPTLLREDYEFQGSEIVEDNDALVLLYRHPEDPAPASIEILETFVHTNDGTAKSNWLRIYVRGKNVKLLSAGSSDDMHIARGWLFDSQDDLLSILDEATHILRSFFSSPRDSRL